MTDVTHASARQKLLLYGFIAFVVAAFLVAIAMLISTDVADYLLPYYGWPIIGFFYAATLKYAIPPLLKRNPVPIRSYFKAISTTLLILVGYGIFTTALGWTGDNFDSPYLTVATVQPLWTVAVPLVWFTVFRIAMTGVSLPIRED
ncbi:hypothetical protein Poly51_48870 [Rubripirellula tenax]|uniref:Uncharacterized protein n=2 Tax=Rubripirellula tenax TaxID=2528015 RepID=A0A5C6EGM6_9BACT|nr:hypothetical protein Poly51_48870 [Rubripirellula tenax]